MNKLTFFSRSAVLATALSFAAITTFANAAVNSGPGGGIPVPIGTGIAAGPGGGIPVPIGTGKAAGPGGGIPVPIGTVAIG